MGLLQRLERLVGFGDAEKSTNTPDEHEVQPTHEPGRECSVCGTSVGVDAEVCPLCQSTALRDRTDDTASTETDTGGDPNAGLDPDRAVTSSSDGTDTAVASERLAELRKRREE